jgi:uncharacterized spore protein YtfJ
VALISQKSSQNNTSGIQIVPFSFIFVKNWDMVTIEVNTRTKAGKALIETARLMAEKFKGIYIMEENSVMVARIKKNHNNDILSEADKCNFVEELREVA